MHAHISPGVDDGAHDWGETMALPRLAYGQGVWHTITTPHSIWNQDTRMLQELCIFPDYHVKAVSDGFSVSLGQEIRYFENPIECLNQGRALTLAGSRYVLVESGPPNSLGGMERAVRQLIQASYFPVITHVERYRCLLEQERPEELAEYGACLQINSLDLNGGWMDKRTRWYRKNLRKGTIHFIVTDMHNSSDCSPDIQTTVSWMKYNMEVRTTIQMIRTNPGYIL